MLEIQHPMIYLAGPDVFRPNSVQHGGHLKQLCAKFGAVGLYPLDGEFPVGCDISPLIRAANLDLIGRCDAVVANMEPFRGPGMDGGTAYEMGVAFALGKIVVGYSRDLRSYAERVAAFSECGRCVDGTLRDADGMQVEDFGTWSVDNLMMAHGVDALYMTAEEAIAHAVRRLRGPTT